MRKDQFKVIKLLQFQDFRTFQVSVWLAADGGGQDCIPHVLKGRQRFDYQLQLFNSQLSQSNPVNSSDNLCELRSRVFRPSDFMISFFQVFSSENCSIGLLN